MLLGSSSGRKELEQHARYENKGREKLGASRKVMAVIFPFQQSES